MTSAYSEAHRRLDRILIFFFVICISGIIVGIVRQEWLFAAVWLAAGFFNGVIGASIRRLANTPETGEDDEFFDRQVWFRNLVNVGQLLSATVMAAGIALGQPWWRDALAAVAIFFVGVFGLSLLCGPRKKRSAQQ
ncbi:hypothetical protein [Methylocella silvestris]|uniref:hypothetical protein n=1 Tax=Methylocella silvestris TaxID=199596 RepID=UPI0011D14102|nr:hypothetical protein [Methylocella silvestris]